MDATKVMPWIDQLPEVGDPIRAERARIADLLDEATRKQRELFELRRRVYTQSVALTQRVAELWTPEEIERAKSHFRHAGR